MKIKHNYYLLPCVDAAKVRQCARDNGDKGEISVVHTHEESQECRQLNTGCEIYGL